MTKAELIKRKFFYLQGVTASFLLGTFIFFSWGCGKKGPLTLEPNPLPTKIQGFTLSQTGKKLILTFRFPEMLADGTTALDPLNIRRIRIFHSTVSLPGNKFRKKASALQPIEIKDLLPSGKNYSFPIPFNTNELDNKKHFFAVTYRYGKQKSPLSEIRMINTVLPAAAVTDLKLEMEGKIIRLNWSKPQKSLSGKNLANLLGYRVYRQITSREKGDSPEVSSFRRLNSQPLDSPIFEDKDTSREGGYVYYVTSLSSAVNESAPSNQAFKEIRDIFAPAVPAGLVNFRARDHMLLTWRKVSDKDLSHYRIYRKTDASADFSLLADKIESNRFQDTQVTRGQIYFYAVTSVDHRGNESEPSQTVSETF